MQATAHLKNARISAQKVRLVADQVRGMPVEKAEQLLAYNPRRAARIVKKVLLSAVANAEHNDGADIDELSISAIQVNEGPTIKRYRARAKGRGTRIFKRCSHITVTVADNGTGQ